MIYIKLQYKDNKITWMDFLDIEKFDYPLTVLGQKGRVMDLIGIFSHSRAEVMKGYGLVQIQDGMMRISNLFLAKFNYN